MNQCGKDDRVREDASAIFARVWRRERKHLYSICLRRAGGNRDDAEDALSRVALKALECFARHLSSISGECAAEIDRLNTAWLKRVAQTVSIDLHRERTSYRHVLDRFAVAGERVSSGAVEQPDEIGVRWELRERIDRVIDDLPPRLREPCRLRFVREMPYHDIAEQLALRNATVRKRIQQARPILQEQIKRYLEHADPWPAPDHIKINSRRASQGHR